jgi:hypothetical protein
MEIKDIINTKFQSQMIIIRDKINLEEYSDIK